MTKEELIALLEKQAREAATQDAREVHRRIQSSGLQPNDTLIDAMRDEMLARRVDLLADELPSLMSQVEPERKSWLRKLFG